LQTVEIDWKKINILTFSLLKDPLLPQTSVVCNGSHTFCKYPRNGGEGGGVWHLFGANCLYFG